VPALKLESVIWFDGKDTVPDVDWTLFKTIVDGGAALIVADAALDGELVPTELIADTR
jgi:hypothetical protein